MSNDMFNMSNDSPKSFKFSASDVAKLLDLPYIPDNAQSEIIEHDLNEPLLVVAGAGSGKTETMTNRIMWVLANYGEEILPEQILGITFTNKAVAELSSRVRRGMNKLRASGKVAISGLNYPNVMTYNSFSSRIITEFGAYIGFANDVQIILDTDCFVLMFEAVDTTLSKMLIGENPNKFLNEYVSDQISEIVTETFVNNAFSLYNNMVNNFLDPEDIFQFVRSQYEYFSKIDLGDRRKSNYKLKRDELLAKRLNITMETVLKYDNDTKKALFEPKTDHKNVCKNLLNTLVLLEAIKEYQNLKIKNKFIDFGDQVKLAYEIVQSSEIVAQTYRDQYKVLILDEYQDTSVSQVRLIQKIFGKNFPIISVGDPNQAIYGFRGASSMGILNFVNDFSRKPGEKSKYKTLKVSRRNSQEILNIANAVSKKITNNVSEIEIPELHCAQMTNHSSKTSQTKQNENDAINIVQVKLCPFEENVEDQFTFANTENQSDESLNAITEEIRNTFSSKNASEFEEVADYLIEHFVNYNKNDSNTKKRTAAVLASVHSDLRRYYDYLEMRGIPAQIVSLAGLIELPEIQDIISLIKIVSDKGENEAMMRILTSPRINITPKILRIINRNAPRFSRDTQDKLENWTLIEKIQLLGNNSPAFMRNNKRFEINTVKQYYSNVRNKLLEIDKSAVFALTALADLINELDSQFEYLQPELFVNKLITKSGIIDELKVINAHNGFAPNLQTISIESFIDAVKNYFNHYPKSNIKKLLDYFKTATKQEKGLSQKQSFMNPEAVQLITIHSSKGLEWDIVCSVGNTVKQMLYDGSGVTTEGGGLITRIDSICGNSPPNGELSLEYLPPTISNWLKNSDCIPEQLSLKVENKNSKMTNFSVDLKQIHDLADFDNNVFQLELSKRYEDFIERRKLSYVAFTRAKTHLLITASLYTRQTKAPTLPTPFFMDAFYVNNGIESGNELVSSLKRIFSDKDLVPQKHKEPIIKNWPNYFTKFKSNHYWQMNTLIVNEILQRKTNPDNKVGENNNEYSENFTLLYNEYKAKVHTIDEIISETKIPDYLSTSNVVEMNQNKEKFIKKILRPIPEEPQIANTVGTKFHDWVQNFYQSGDVDLHIKNKYRYVSDFQNKLLTIDNIAKNFLASKWSKLIPIATETVCPVIITKDGESYEIMSKIDAIFEFDDEILIVDWKTGSPPSSQTDLHNKIVQLAMYRVGYINSYIGNSGKPGNPTKPVNCAFVYVKNDNESNVLRFEAATLEKRAIECINNLDN